MAYLRFSSRNAESFDQELVKALTIGRAPTCDLCLPDGAMSRQHCRIEPDGDRWLVVDLDSRNGTFINGRRIQRQHLKDGDRLHVGDSVLTFTQSAPTGIRPATPKDALLLARVDNELSASTISGKRILPTPRPRKTGKSAAPANAPEPSPSPMQVSSMVFSRPPARPMIRPDSQPAESEG
ncbi:MAG: FHA domain-containing protein [Phycisphaerales bacterium]|nr:FHA domain-containing protein [Phycisphaerales bacterium]